MLLSCDVCTIDSLCYIFYLNHIGLSNLGQARILAKRKRVTRPQIIVVIVIARVPETLRPQPRNPRDLNRRGLI